MASVHSSLVGSAAKCGTFIPRIVLLQLSKVITEIVLACLLTEATSKIEDYWIKR